ncbi:hypothetical protein ACTMU2_10095 [Cupriavidus basilensis]
MPDSPASIASCPSTLRTPSQLPAGDPPAASVTGCALFRQLEALADAQPDSVAVGCATYRDLVDASLALAGYTAAAARCARGRPRPADAGRR